jgi:hypothetical protein
VCVCGATWDVVARPCVTISVRRVLAPFWVSFSSLVVCEQVRAVADHPFFLEEREF